MEAPLEEQEELPPPFPPTLNSQLPSAVMPKRSSSSTVLSPKPHPRSRSVPTPPSSESHPEEPPSPVSVFWSRARRTSSSVISRSRRCSLRMEMLLESKLPTTSGLTTLTCHPTLTTTRTTMMVRNLSQVLSEREEV